MPLKMMMMCKKYIITLQTSNYKLNKSVSMADLLIYKAVIKKSIWPGSQKMPGTKMGLFTSPSPPC